jgi:hypothetical protein
MTNIRLEDNGCMAAVMAPLDVVDDFLARIDGYVVKANINSVAQCVIGGETKAVEQAVKTFKKAGYAAVKIQVSHAFHRTVAPASDPLGVVLDRLLVGEPKLPLVANVTGELYPTGVPEIKEILKRQIANPVQWVKGLETLYAEGVRTFVEVGPKKSLKGFTDDVHRPDLVSLATNHRAEPGPDVQPPLRPVGRATGRRRRTAMVVTGAAAAGSAVRRLRCSTRADFPVPPPDRRTGGPVPQPFVPPPLSSPSPSSSCRPSPPLLRARCGPDRNATPVGSSSSPGRPGLPAPRSW